MIGTDQNGAVTTVRIDYSGGNNEHTLFLASDLHVDAVGCDRERLLSDRTLKDKEAAGLLTSRKVKLPNRRIATAYRKVQ